MKELGEMLKGLLLLLGKKFDFFASYAPFLKNQRFLEELGDVALSPSAHPHLTRLPDVSCNFLECLQVRIKTKK